MRNKILFILLFTTFIFSQNYSLSFDGVDDYVEIKGIEDSFDNFSLGVWVKSNQTNNGSIVIREGFNSNSDFWQLRSSGYPSISLYIYINGSGDSQKDKKIYDSTQFLDGDWHFITCTRKSNIVKVFIDGELISEYRGPSGTIVTNAPLKLGAGVIASREFQGNLDNLMIFNYDLLQEEIQSYMTISPTGSETGLVGYWNFNEGTGTTLTDQTSNGNNGTINGATWSTPSPADAPKATISSTETSPTNKSPIPVNVNWDIKVNDFISSDITVNNATLQNFKNQAGSSTDHNYTFDLIPSADGNVTVDIASGVAKNSYNIDNVASDQFLIVSDRTVPIAGTVNDGTDNDIDVQNNPSTLNANWTGFSDALSGIASYDWAIGSSSGGTEILDWANAGNTTSANKSNLILINDQTYYISVRVIDKAGNTSAVATSDGIKTDFSSPSAPTDFVAISNDGSITLQWTKNTESDIANYKIYRSTQAGFSLSSDSLIYGASATETQYVDQQVVYGVTHYYKMTATDLAGNEGTASSEVNGRSIDTTPPTVSITAPIQNEQFEIGTSLTVSWSGNDNVGISSVDINYSLDESTTWNEIVNNLTGLESHQWLAPNVITNNLIIQVIVYDADGLSDTATVDSIDVYPVYPKIVTIDPDLSILRWLHQDISITFSRDMDPTVFTKQNVVVTSEYSSEPELLYNTNDKKLIIRNSGGYVSLDTVKIKLNASGLTSTFGYQMDGDGDGIEGGDLSLQYNTLMLADFDTSNTIDVSDLAIFLTALETKNYYYDIGPVLNTAPHFLVQPDSKFDLEDVMSFVMMWNWYTSTTSSASDQWLDTGNPVNLEFDHKNIILEFPNDAIAGEVHIFDLNSQVEYKIANDDNILSFDFYNEETNLLTYLTERSQSGVITIPIKITGKIADMDVRYKFVDANGNIVSQSRQSIKIENIPDQFKLHQNYPNPFNPITTINYDLPQQTHVNLMIYDILGREVVKLVSEEIPAGYKTIIWDSRNNYGDPVSAGIYFYQIQTKEFVKTKKMILIK